MANIDKTLWGIHAGKTGDAGPLFLKQNVIALAWKEMGDLSKIAANRDAFRVRMIECYPEGKPGAVPVQSGQLFRFVHEMQIGDFVAYPAKSSRQINIGRITGSYQYNPTLDAGYPHTRSVEWLKSFARTYFSQGALYELGSAMSLFQVRNYADEYFAALESKDSPSPIPATKDETVALVADEIQQTTSDFILKQLAQELKGHPFAHFVAHLLETMGYRTRVSPEGTDGGVDIIAHKDELGFEPPIIKVQVKSGEGNIGAPAVQALYGNVGDKGEFGLFVTLGTFTPPAKNFARSKSNLRLIDGVDLVDLVLQHYDSFDSRYKALIPLQRVYIPQALDNDNA